MASNKAGHDLKRLLRPWSIAGMALVLLTLFGGLVEAGVVVPKFDVLGTGVEGSSIYFNTIENSSWRSWTITGVRLTGGLTSSRLADGSTLHIAGLYRGEEPPTGNNLSIAPIPFELAAGQSVTFTLVREHVPTCKPVPLQTGAQLRRYQAELDNNSGGIGAEVSVATPLGTREIPVDFDFSYGCP